MAKLIPDSELSKIPVKDDGEPLVPIKEFCPKIVTVDLLIIGPDGRQLEMGEKMGRFTEKTATHSRKISPQARKNRKLLINFMTKAGFVNYPTEWWHWSYGDQYWAASLNKKYSVYAGI